MSLAFRNRVEGTLSDVWAREEHTHMFTHIDWILVLTVPVSCLFCRLPVAGERLVCELQLGQGAHSIFC